MGTFSACSSIVLDLGSTLSLKVQKDSKLLKWTSGYTQALSRRAKGYLEAYYLHACTRTVQESCVH